MSAVSSNPSSAAQFSLTKTQRSNRWARFGRYVAFLSSSAGAIILWIQTSNGLLLALSQSTPNLTATIEGLGAAAVGVVAAVCRGAISALRPGRTRLLADGVIAAGGFGLGQLAWLSLTSQFKIPASTLPPLTWLALSLFAVGVVVQDAVTQSPTMPVWAERLRNATIRSRALPAEDSNEDA